jgi:hypothetical protein
VAVVVIGGAVLADAAVRSHTSDRVTGPATGLIRTTKSWDVGPSAEYGSDFGSIGEVHPLRLTLPSGSTYDAVVIVALDYRTSPSPDRFVARLVVREGERFGPIIASDPKGRPLAVSTSRSSATLMFQLTGLQGGTEYWFMPSVNVLHRDTNASITTTDVLAVVDATAASS